MGWGIHFKSGYLNSSDSISNCAHAIHSGVLCNRQCPDELEFGELTSNNWPLWSKIIVSVLVVGLAVICMVIKIAFVTWLWWLEKKQDAYLDSLEGDEEQTDALLVHGDIHDHC